MFLSWIHNNRNPSTMLNMDNTVVVVGGGGGGGRGRGRGTGTSSMENSKPITKSVDGGSDQFPAGLKVLVVDDDPTCLKILERMLQSCRYEVTTCTRAVVALNYLREKKYYFDLVLSDVHMPDMDGFKLLELIGLEMDLPVLMMSVDDKPEVVMKGVTHGACDYLIKPIRIEALKTIWQHVVRKRQTESKEFEQSDSVEDGDGHRRQADDNDYASSENDGSWKNSKKRKEEDDEGEDRDDTSALKKPRVVWSIELHQQFVAAVNQLSIDKAVPKKILELMNVPGLTRENVASHLQKYRLYLKRISSVEPQHQGGLNNSFMLSQEANYGPMSSFDGLNFQALSVPSQLHTGGGLARSTSHTGIGMQHVDQRKLFETSRLRFGSGKQLGNNNQVNLLHGRPTSIELKQLNHINHSIQPLGHLGQISEGAGSLPHVGRNQGSSLMMQMPQSQLRGQLINGIPMSIGGHQIFSSGINGQVLGGNGTVINGRGATHNSHASPMVGFSMNHVTELSGNGFRLGSDAGESSLQSTVTFQGGGNIETKGSVGPHYPSYDTQGPSAFHPTFDIFNTLSQNKSPEWELQTVGRTIEALRHAMPLQGDTDPLSVLGQQVQTSGGIGKAMAPSEEVNQHVNPDTAQCHNDFPNEDPFRANGNLSSQAMLLPRIWSQDDLYSPFSKQVLQTHQEDMLGSTDLNFDNLSRNYRNSSSDFTI